MGPVWLREVRREMGKDRREENPFLRVEMLLCSQGWRRGLPTCCCLISKVRLSRGGDGDQG